MNVVEPFGFHLAHVKFLEPDNLEAFCVDAGNDLAGFPGSKGIGLDDGKGFFHDVFPPISTFSEMGVLKRRAF